MNLEQTCEVIFQLHKSNKGLSWAKEIYREYELARTAKDKMIKEEIIFNPTYGDRTQLNSKVINCDSYEQAFGLLKHGSKYARPVFGFFKQRKFDGEYYWNEIVESCNIPIEDSEDVKNILSYHGFIYKTDSTDSGDLVKGSAENITAALYGLEKKGQTLVQVNQISESLLVDSPISQRVTTTPKIKDSTSKWYTSHLFIYIIWPLIVLLIGGYILFKLGWVG